MSSASTPEPPAARLANLVGAWSVAVADRLNDATATAAGRGGQAPAALVALHEFSNGRPIEHLRSVLGLTHSATVRLVDALAADGLVERRQSGEDRRSIAVTLTTAGRRRAERVARARSDAITKTIEALSDIDRDDLTRVLEHLVADMTTLRLRERDRANPPARGWLCRLCDFDACGRDRGDCPSASTAAARLDAPSPTLRGSGEGGSERHRGGSAG